MTFTKGMTASDEGDCLLIVHCHTSEGFTDVTGRRDGVTITAMSLVTHSIKTPGEYSSGVPLMDNRSWRRAAVRFKQLDSLLGGKKDKENK